MNRKIAYDIFEREPHKTELPIVLDEYGNTGASSVLLAFHQYHQDLKPGDIGVLCSFGAGYAGRECGIGESMKRLMCCNLVGPLGLEPRTNGL
jgi:3-oxoacyl-[acyl-carrier-protein] synthase III